MPRPTTVHQKLSLSFKNAKRLEDAAKRSGYELSKVYEEIGRQVIEQLGFRDIRRASSEHLSLHQRKVTVFVDSLNMLGFLD